MPGIGLIQQIVGGVVLAIILALSIALWAADRRADKWEAQAQKLSRALKRISTAKDEQRKTTSVNIVKAGEGGKAADQVARRIEAAPLPGQCKTPAAVLEGDL